jgi:uncharacterized protein YciI
MKLFVVILRYVASQEKVDAVRHLHLEFVHECYKQDVFLLSGPQEPLNGGMIVAQAESRASLVTLLQQDPFVREGVAEVSVYNFKLSRYHPELAFFNKYM